MEILFRQPSFQGISPAKITTKSSLLDLPTEIVSKIFKLVPNQLKATCKTCYLLYNEYYCEKLVDEMGNDIIYNIAMYNIPYLVDYIKSFDYWRYDLRNMIAKEYDLKDYEQDSNIRRQMTPKEIVECKYVKDSWKLVYAIFKNRRLFVEYQDYEIDEPQSYLSYSMLHINKTYLVKYKKSIKLSSDLYNLSCGIVIQNALGLGSMNFKVIRTDTKEELMSFFPPTNINDLVPHERFVMLDLGVFYVAPPKKTVLNNDTPSGFEIPSSMQTDKLVEVDIIMEETGLYLKSGFIICYVDVNAYPSTLKKLDPETNDKLVPVEEKRWIAWSIDNQVPHPENVVNVLLKRLYKSINTSLFLKPLPSPFQRIGSFAEIASRKSSLLVGSSSDIGSFSHMGHRRVDSNLSMMDASQTHDETIIEEEADGTSGMDDEFDSNIKRIQELCKDTEPDIDLETYNKNFYSKYNEDNQELTRTFRFINIVDRRRYEANQSANKRLPRNGAAIRDEPLKWKLQTVFEV